MFSNRFMVRNSRQSSIPFGCGIIISRIIKSGEKSMATEMAFWLSLSTCTWKPSFTRLYSSKSRISLSSSITNTRKRLLSLITIIHVMQASQEALLDYYSFIILPLLMPWWYKLNVKNLYNCAFPNRIACSTASWVVSG